MTALLLDALLAPLGLAEAIWSRVAPALRWAVLGERRVDFEGLISQLDAVCPMTPEVETLLAEIAHERGEVERMLRAR